MIAQNTLVFLPQRRSCLANEVSGTVLSIAGATKVQEITVRRFHTRTRVRTKSGIIVVCDREQLVSTFPEDRTGTPLSRLRIGDPVTALVKNSLTQDVIVSICGAKCGVGLNYALLQFQMNPNDSPVFFAGNYRGGLGLIASPMGEKA